MSGLLCENGKGKTVLRYTGGQCLILANTNQNIKCHFRKKN